MCLKYLKALQRGQVQKSVPEIFYSYKKNDHVGRSAKVNLELEG